LVTADALALVGRGDAHVACLTPSFAPGVAIDDVRRALLDAKSDSDNNVVECFGLEAALVVNNATSVTSEEEVIGGDVRKHGAFLNGIKECVWAINCLHLSEALRLRLFLDGA